MNMMEWIIEKFLDNEVLLEEGKANVLEVVNELEGEGVTVSAGLVTNVQTVTRHVLAVQRRAASTEFRRTGYM
jgi:copper homeostasis protein CutC